MKLRKQIHKALAYDLNLRQLLTMSILEAGTTTPTAIAKEIVISTASVTIIIDKLEKMSIVNREFDKEDRRSILLTLTDHGRDILTEINTGGEHLTTESYNAA